MLRAFYMKHTSYVDRQIVFRIFLAMVSFIFMTDIYFVLSTKNSILSLVSPVNHASLGDGIAIVIIYIFVSGYVTPALYNFFEFVFLVNVEELKSLTLRRLAKLRDLQAYALVHDNASIYKFLGVWAETQLVFRSRGLAAFNVFCLCLGELVLMKHGYSPLVKDAVLRSSNILPSLGGSVAVFELILFIHAGILGISSVRWSRRIIPFNGNLSKSEEDNDGEDELLSLG